MEQIQPHLPRRPLSVFFDYPHNESEFQLSSSFQPSSSTLESNTTSISCSNVDLLTPHKIVRLPKPPPNGGLVAWLQVLVGHLLVFNGFGYVTSYGIFQAHNAERYGQSESNIAWIGSIQVFLLFFIGTLSGRAMDAGYFRRLIFAGCTLQIVGVFATSFARNYWQLFLAQGVAQGLGNGLLFTPTVALVSTYFSTRRALALGLAACGAPTGGIIYPLVYFPLLPNPFCEC
jgi:MFS family permease